MTDATPNFVRLGDLTAPAFAEALKRNPVILLPLGSQEDHGPHQPMGDYLLAETIAERIARRAHALGAPAYVAPGLPFGVADYFGSSPGGLALSAESFRHVLDDLLHGLLRHGLTRIVILNAHGGNVPVIHQATLALRRARRVVVPSFYLWKVARQLMERRLGGAGQARFGHGAEPLLSLNLALRGDCVSAQGEPARAPGKAFGLPVSGFGTIEFQGVQVEVPVEFEAVPRAAIAAAWPEGSAELGAEVAEALVQAGAAFARLVYERAIGDYAAPPGAD
ncbi:creatininase family protein [Acidocella sp. KAb 2-4]|uniref:creatininase family protein n=1 Tax=Acidocella sp. KAb 2-4 TaxID=2885158 RepID=UPI001D086C75|nr:creatininase family protein [Acidocella sp. KAb 2-4]MCB5943569.1 creatininase family protein [Acidocella sp. KAb 2-4]